MSEIHNAESVPSKQEQPDDKEEIYKEKSEINSYIDDCGKEETVSFLYSETDGWMYTKPKPCTSVSVTDAKELPLSNGVMSVRVDDEYYKMDHSRRGVAAIFNHVVFETMNERRGSDKDVKKLTESLKALDFEVRVYKDLTYTEISEVLENLSREDHFNADCLLVAVMSHGDQGVIYARNHQYPVDELWRRFTGNKCLSLAGKPKLFLIQACRGTYLDSGVTLKSRTRTDGSPSGEYSYAIPAMADILVMYSTFEGHYAWRNPDHGSWFIQALSEELTVNGKSRDLMTVLTFTSRRVAVGYESTVPNNEKMDKKKQIPSIVSMLTRLICFGGAKH